MLGSSQFFLVLHFMTSNVSIYTRVWAFEDVGGPSTGWHTTDETPCKDFLEAVVFVPSSLQSRFGNVHLIIELDANAGAEWEYMRVLHVKNGLLWHQSSLVPLETTWLKRLVIGLEDNTCCKMNGFTGAWRDLISTDDSPPLQGCMRQHLPRSSSQHSRTVLSWNNPDRKQGRSLQPNNITSFFFDSSCYWFLVHAWYAHPQRGSFDGPTLYPILMPRQLGLRKDRVRKNQKGQEDTCCWCSHVFTFDHLMSVDKGCWACGDKDASWNGGETFSFAFANRRKRLQSSLFVFEPRFAGFTTKCDDKTVSSSILSLQPTH